MSIFLILTIFLKQGSRLISISTPPRCRSFFFAQKKNYSDLLFETHDRITNYDRNRGLYNNIEKFSRRTTTRNFLIWKKMASTCCMVISFDIVCRFFVLYIMFFVRCETNKELFIFLCSGSFHFEHCNFFV